MSMLPGQVTYEGFVSRAANTDWPAFHTYAQSIQDCWAAAERAAQGDAAVEIERLRDRLDRATYVPAGPRKRLPRASR